MQRISLVFLMLIFGISARAEFKPRTKSLLADYIYSVEPDVQNGIRISVGFVSHGITGVKNVPKLNSTQSFSMGYAMIPRYGFGYLGKLSTRSYKAGGYALIDINRFEGNLAMSFGAKSYGYAGLNIISIDGLLVRQLNAEASMGYQLGVGYQLNYSFSIEAEFAAQNIVERGSGPGEAHIGGLEVSLIAVF